MTAAEPKAASPGAAGRAGLRGRGWLSAWALLAGLAQAASNAAPSSIASLWWLQLLSLAALAGLLGLLRVRDAGWRGGLWCGWLFASAWLAGSFWWLFVSMHTYGGLPAPLAALAVLALAAALALYYALACGCFVARAPAGAVPAALCFAALWTLAELLRGSWFTGFPWAAGGYAHVDGPLAGYAPWVGVYGIGAVAAAVAAALAFTFAWGGGPPPQVARPARARARVQGLAPRWRTPLPALGLCALLLGLPQALPAPSTTSAGRLQVALLQGNIPQDEKFIPGSGIATALEWYGEQLRDARAPLVVTPETALPLLPRQLPPGYLEAIAQRYTTGNQAAIVGLPLGDAREGYTNSVLGLRPGAAPYRYDKHHLVPFGEFVPWGFHWFIDLMRIPLGDFRRGALVQPAFEWQGQRIAPNICYEDLFGDEIGARFTDDASAPTLLLNVSNIAWFGDTVAIDQHLAISRMRALEFARPVLRATNTGATALIDYRGRVVQMLPRLTRGVLLVEADGRRGRTPYAHWVALAGLWPLWGLALAGVALGVGRRRR